MNYLKYFNILLKAKINKKLQMRYVTITDNTKEVVIRNFGELYLSEFFNEICINIDKYMASDKEILLKIIVKLAQKNKKIRLIENVKVFTDEDIKYLYEISQKITLFDRYMDNSKSLAGNQILMCDISSYRLIIEKLDYFEEICNKYFKNDFEKIIFSIVELADYIEYSEENARSNSCLTNAFLLKTGVCIDMSIALWKCLERLNIDCLIIKGFANDNEKDNSTLYNHAWNQVKLDNKWYNIDVTWFQSQDDVKFLFSDDETFYKDGKHKSRFDKKRCIENKNKDEILKKVEEIRKFQNIFEEYDKGNREIELIR